VRLLSVRRGACSLTLAIALLVVAPAHAAPGAIPIAAARPDRFDFALRRAALEQAQGNLPAVIAQLEPLDLSLQVPPARDRAAFLLAHAYAELGRWNDFRRAATIAAQWHASGPFTDWIARRRELLAAEGDGDPAGALLARVRGAAPSATAAVRGAADSTGAPYRADLLVRAANEMDLRQWEAAAATYARAEDDRARERARLGGMLAAKDHATLWAAWEAGLAPGDALLVDAAPLVAAGRALAVAASDLAKAPNGDVPALTVAPVVRLASVPPPTRSEWQSVVRLARELSESDAKRAETRAQLAREDARLAALRGYSEFGLRQLRTERALLEQRSVRLDALSASVAALGGELDSVRAEATRRVVARANVIVRECEAHQVWLGAMRHFHIVGAAGERSSHPPPGVPNADSLTRAELELTGRIRDFATRMAAEAPALIARSHAEAWRPGVLDRVGVLAANARAQLAWVRTLEAAIDSNRVAAASSADRRALAARTDSLSAAVDSLRQAHEALRARAAERALEAAIASLDGEREAIDYGLAAASYGASVRTASADSTVRTVVARSGPGAPAAVPPEMPADDPETVAWRTRAIVATDSFLVRHPDSFARGEMRFRLADLLLTDARQGFRDRMAAFLEAQKAGQADVALPLVDHARPLALYDAILAQDSSFVHRDAVLFNAGSILAEDGEAGADRYFRELVAVYPQSPFAQEAHLRIGDLHFDAGQYADCIAPYEQAAAGADANLALVALYKLGWAEFSRDRFLPAAGAFCRVLDLYEAKPATGGGLDLRKETEAFLIHTFARAGGADAFAGYFDRVGPRPYAPRVLVAMGQHFRRFSLYAQAERADSLHLERYPLDPEALVSAERRAETFQRAGQPDRALEARALYAPRFAAQSAWSAAQRSDSVRTAGAQFARTSWAKLALYHHQKAAREGARSDWQEALRLDRLLLAQAPDDPAAPAFALQAGEASAALGDDAAALEFYATAARTGKDSIPDLALRQSLSVTDNAYERSRGPNGAAGSDTLARAVLAAGDALLAHDPGRAAGDAVRWRQGNLAFAHGWYERAIKDLEPLTAAEANPKRAPLAAGLRAEAMFRLERYEDAGAAFEVARLAAVRAGNDSLAQKAARALPVCAYRRAEAAVRADSTAYENQARLFGDVATRWPAYDHAPLARYRSGLAWRKAGKPAEAVAAMESLVAEFPRSEFVRDATLQIAQTWQEAGQYAKAADASVAFARRYPKDEGARDALLGAADLYAQAGDSARADGIRTAYVREHPEDHVNAMAIREDLARRELAALPKDRPISSLLPAAPAKGRKAAASQSQLAQYLALAKTNPELVSRPLLAELYFRQGEEARVPYEAVRLTLPLPKSIAQKRKQLDALLALYRKSVDLSVAEWAQASAYRIGEALVGFGLALDASERPAGLAGDDLRAYEDVLFKESQVFYDRGEGVWADVLAKRAKDAEDGPWLKQAEVALWKRLGDRFVFKAEVRFPTIQGSAPPESSAAQAPKTPPPPKGSSAALAPGMLGSDEANQHPRQESRP